MIHSRQCIGKNFDWGVAVVATHRSLPFMTNDKVPKLVVHPASTSLDEGMSEGVEIHTPIGEAMGIAPATPPLPKLSGASFDVAVIVGEVREEMNVARIAPLGDVVEEAQVFQLGMDRQKARGGGSFSGRLSQSK